MLISFLDACPSSELLIEPREVRAPCILQYSNVEKLQPAFGHHMRHEVYAARTCLAEGIHLGKMEPGATVLGGGEFLLRCSGGLLYDQVRPALRENAEALEWIAAAPRETVDISDEALLVARYGVITWGHWLVELLPKIVLVERLFPGRFRYVLPEQTVDWHGKHPSYRNVHQSIAAYGVAPDQIIPIRDSHNYRFSDLYAASRIWTNFMVHPEIAALMRDALPGDAAPGLGRIALLRTDSVGRRIANIGPVLAMLEQRGFRLAETAEMPFLDQVALFRGATEIVAVLGSALTGLLYAPPGVRVLVLAPDNFGDRFFYALTQLRGGRWADVRGQVVEANPRIPHLSSFTVDLEEVERGLAALD